MESVSKAVAMVLVAATGALVLLGLVAAAYAIVRAVFY